MASIGHVAMGLTAARWLHPPQRSGAQLLGSMVFWSGLSLAPDLDVVGFYFGVNYGDAWGHRGATHSLAFALGVAILAFAWRSWLPAARSFSVSARKLALVAFLVTASHGLLDTLTDGGLGCALLWPFNNERLFAPWNPIPVSPLGLRFLSSRGLSVALVELALFSPFFLYALLPRRKRRQ